MKKYFLYPLLFFILVVMIASCKKAEELLPSNAITENNNVITSESGQKEVADPCNNVLVPLALGNQWIYESQIKGEDGQPEIIEFAWTVSEAHDSSVELGTLFYNSGAVLRSTILCQDGAILNFPVTQLSMVFGDVDGELFYDYISGVFMPSLSDFEAENWENTWETNFTSSGVFTANYEGETAIITLSKSPVTMSWRAIEKDLTIQVPAGSFDDAVLIKQKSSFDISSLQTTIDGQVLDTATKLVLNSNLWFSPNIGLLKQELESATIELYGMAFPIKPMGKIELKSSNTIK